MTYEGALYWHVHNGATIEQERESEILIKDALEKQIPKKPMTSFSSDFFWCPDCERALKMRIEQCKINIRYCPFCGQALDWSDIDER